MRRIKFRAWCKCLRLMLPITALDFENELAVILDNKQIRITIDFDEVKLLQFTGIKDRECKDIYEGDIVKDINGEVYYVAYSPPYFACYRNGQHENSKLETQFFDLSVEIIGTIYENPELLKEGK